MIYIFNNKKQLIHVSHDSTTAVDAFYDITGHEITSQEINQRCTTGMPKRVVGVGDFEFAKENKYPITRALMSEYI
jgi:hypothetical protein